MQTKLRESQDTMMREDQMSRLKEGMMRGDTMREDMREILERLRELMREPQGNTIEDMTRDIEED